MLSQPQVASQTPHDTRSTKTPHTPLACPRCGAIDQPTLAPGTGPHAFRANCRHCGRFLQWVSQHTPAERAARRAQHRLQAMAQQPPSPMQLAYLAALGDTPTAPPATMAEASQRIERLKCGRVA